MIFASHWKALGKTGKARWFSVSAWYLPAISIAVTFWCCWNYSLTKDTLNIMATIQSVVATVLLTVMGSIYSGLPGAVRRARISRKIADDSAKQLLEAATPNMEDLVHRPRRRASFEQSRLDVLKGVFAHTATAVVLALFSLPLILSSVQMDGGEGAVLKIREWTILGSLLLTCSTMSVMGLVLSQVHTLVHIDVNDLDPASES